MTQRAQISATTLRLSYSIRRDIRAKPETIWALLTDARRFPSWNSTVTRIDGDIALGQRLAIEVPLAPGRIFKPKVTKLVVNREMEWSDGFAPMFRGVRTFVLTPKGEGGDRVLDAGDLLGPDVADDQGQPARLRAGVRELRRRSPAHRRGWRMSRRSGRIVLG